MDSVPILNGNVLLNFFAGKIVEGFEMQASSPDLTLYPAPASLSSWVRGTMEPATWNVVDHMG